MLASTAAALVALAAPAGAAGPAATQRALDRAMDRAGPAAGAYAVDVATGRVIYERRPDARLVPASVAKLYTTAAALDRFGADGRLTTAVLAKTAPAADGTLAGDVVLRGGGDPELDRGGMRRLAAAVAGAGVERIEGDVIGDESAWDGRRGPPSSRFALSRYVGPLSALTYQRGLTKPRGSTYQTDPPRVAASALRNALRKAGIRVTGRPRAARAAVTATVQLAREPSPPMSAIVKWTNAPSDNFRAESLLKALGARFGGGGSTAAGAAVVRSSMARYGISPRVADGSGLSRSNRTSAREVVRLLEKISLDGDGFVFSDSLAVAGRTGTLHDRMRRSAARDVCRGKTGSLFTVSALAGYCRAKDGTTIAFAYLMNGVSPFGARPLQDDMTAALARYSG